MFLVLLLFLTSQLGGSDAVLKQIHVLFRHGERSPTSTFPNDIHKDYKWDGVGYLTVKGKLQMYTLGERLREYYSGFVSKYYWPPEVNFTSSSWDRCLMSAELLGAGLFPPNDEQIWNSELLWQPIPIHYLPRNLDNLIVMKTNCTEYDNEFIRVKNSSKVLSYNNKYHQLYEYLTEHTGTTIDNIEAVESIFNTLEIYQQNNFSLPFWVNHTLMDQMKNIAAQNLAIYSETEYMKRMKGGFFLKTILDLIEADLNKTKKVPIINIYSAHDLTIVHVLRALHLVDDTLKPDVGASVIIELHNDFTLKIFYWESWNGKAVEQVLPNCSFPCTVDKFRENYKSVLPVNWAEECQIRY